MANAVGAALCGLAVVIVILGFARGGHAMARAEITDDAVRVVPLGLGKLWSLHGSVSIDAARIAEVHTSDEAMPAKSARFGGRLMAGTYRSGGTRAFLVVGRARPVVVIECPGGPWNRVVFSAADPDAVVRDITRVLPSHLP